MATNKNGSIRKSKTLVIVGDGMCNRTRLLFSFREDLFISNIQVDGKTVSDFELEIIFCIEFFYFTD